MHVPTAFVVQHFTSIYSVYKLDHSTIDSHNSDYAGMVVKLCLCTNSFGTSPDLHLEGILLKSDYHSITEYFVLI